jgi:hypothetical protein
MINSNTTTEIQKMYDPLRARKSRHNPQEAAPLARDSRPISLAL